MFKSISTRVMTLLSCGVVLFSSGAALAQTSPLYINREYRFEIIFPSEPMAKDTTHTTSSGALIPARQFFVEQNGDLFSVTVVHLPAGPEIDEKLMEDAANQLRQRGEVR